MPSSLTWLDVSAENQRRVRDMIRLFEEPGTRDEFGIGPVRGAFGDLLLPGTSTIQTRARYFLFIPWHFQDAQRRGARGQQLTQRVDRSERQLIERFCKGRPGRGVDRPTGRSEGEDASFDHLLEWAGSLGSADRVDVATSGRATRIGFG